MSAPTLTDSLRETLDVFDTGEPRTTQEVAAELDLGRRSTYARLERLVEQERIETKKVGASARVWWKTAPSIPPPAKQAATDSEAEFASLIAAVDEYAIFGLDVDGRVRTWNPGAKRIKGYHSDDIVGEHFSIFYTDEARRAGVPQENLSKAAEQGTVEDEGWRLRADGSRFWANVTISAITTDDGELTGFAKVTRDMTDRREHERALRGQLEFTERLLEAAPAGVLVIERDGTFSAANERAGELLDLDLTDGEIQRVGIKTVYDAEGQFLPPDDRPYVQIFDEGEPVRDWHAEVELSDDSRRWLSTNIEPIADEAGTVQQAVVTIQDITRLKAQADRLNRQREELQEELDEIFARVDDAFLALDPDWRITYANDRAAAIVGLTPGELVGARVWDVLYELEEGEPRELAEDAMESLEPVEFEYFSELLDSWFEVRGFPSETGLSVYFRDITERKARENTLEQYETTIETVWDGVTTLDADDRFLMVNDAFCGMTGYDREEVIGEHATLILDDEVFERARELHERVERGELDIATLEYELQTADGGTIPVEARFGPCELADGSIGGTGVIRDISKRKDRERALAESERRYRTLVDHFPDGAVALFDEELRYTAAGGELLNDLGLDPEDPVDETIHERYPPELANRIEGHFWAALGGERNVFEVEYMGKNLRAYTLPVPAPNGGVSAGMLMVQDVTEQRELEAELRERQERYRDLFTSMTEGYCVIEKVETLPDEPIDFRYLEANPAFVENAGVDEVVGKTIREVVPNAAAEWFQRYDTVVETGEAIRFDRELEAVGRHLECYAFPVGEETDEQVGVLFTDVTERVEHERFLADAKAQLEAATEAGAVGTWEWHIPEDRCVSDASLAQTFSVDPDDAREGVSMDEFVAAIHEDDRGGVMASLEAAMDDCGEYEEEYRVWNADGDLRWVVARGEIECDEDGEPQTFPGALTDITDRKRAELQLARHRDRLAVLNGINEVVHEITDAVLDQSTRAEIEQTACDALTAAEAFEFAWIAGGAPGATPDGPRATATVEARDETVTHEMIRRLRAEDAPGAIAIRDREPQALRDGDSDPWGELAREHGFGALAVIPIVHDDFVLGVLGLESDRENAFDAEELDVVGRLGEILGHAISSAQRKQALMSEEVVELEFRLTDAFDALAPDIKPEGTITLEHAVGISEEEFLVYGTATADAAEALPDLVEAIPHWDAITIRDRGDPVNFELRSTGPPVLSTISSLGGYFVGSTIEAEEIRLTIHLAPSVDIRRVIEAVEDAYPQAEMLSRRQLTRDPDDLRPIQQRVLENLTDRQRVALETSFHSGYFEWPREASGEEVASSLDIAPATFSQHLRKAEQQVFEAILSPTAQRLG